VSRTPPAPRPALPRHMIRILTVRRRYGKRHPASAAIIKLRFANGASIEIPADVLASRRPPRSSAATDAGTHDRLRPDLQSAALRQALPGVGATPLSQVRLASGFAILEAGSGSWPSGSQTGSQ
jgi:hypothetical protein